MGPIVELATVYTCCVVTVSFHRLFFNPWALGLIIGSGMETISFQATPWSISRCHRSLWIGDPWCAILALLLFWLLHLPCLWWLSVATWPLQFQNPVIPIWYQGAQFHSIISTRNLGLQRRASTEIFNDAVYSSVAHSYFFSEGSSLWPPGEHKQLTGTLNIQNIYILAHTLLWTLDSFLNTLPRKFWHSISFT